MNKPPHASRWLRLKRWLGLAPEQSTCCWCHECGNELVSDKRTKCTDDVLVHYTCGECGTDSVWDFDTYGPVVVRLKTPEQIAEHYAALRRAGWVRK